MGCTACGASISYFRKHTQSLSKATAESVFFKSVADKVRKRLRHQNAEKDNDQSLRAPAAFLPAQPVENDDFVPRPEWEIPPPEPPGLASRVEQKRRAIQDDLPEQFKRQRTVDTHGNVEYPENDRVQASSSSMSRNTSSSPMTRKSDGVVKKPLKTFARKVLEKMRAQEAQNV